MKLYNGNDKQEKRKKRYITPILYFSAELILAWIILSVINISFNIFTWASWSHVALFIIFIYFGYKTYKIFKRQRNLKRA